ncbi:MAG: SDR family oxidoreductase [Vampirovibrionales bacterium]|nr:SDR family oxidoreductase [Vampirovibrionales bacterium]
MKRSYIISADFKKPSAVLVLGATGYVGGRLVPLLLEAGYHVRAASRSIRKLQDRPWARHANVELVAADVSGESSLLDAMKGVEAVYYLVHSMLPGQKDFAKADRIAARNVVEAAKTADVKRIIYLGGLGEDSPDLSKHLQSRAEVARILKTGSVPVTVLRAAMIIGSGSASFEILRYLVERLPVMITPKWVSTPSQPIAIRNVLYYLLKCLETPETVGQTFDIGGPEVLPYLDLMKIYAEEARLPERWIIPVPVFTPRLSSYWIHLVTPVPSSLARPLAEGLKNPAVCLEDQIETLIPQTLLTCREAIRLALVRLHEHAVETHWTDAGSLPPVEKVYPGDPNWSGGSVYQDRRQVVVDGLPEAIWPHVVRIGGETGWYYANPLWRLRGILDRLFGGVGHRRGRRSPDVLMAGDALDVWRVLEIAPNRYLKLLAEMKMPGTAILAFELTPGENGTTILRQTAWFAARGLSGFLYWYAVMPFHNFIFDGMLKGIARASSKMILSGPSHSG